ncbi:hypothetical protein DPMN_078604 [Dreissena polymorpha]|uniref:Uncharacterized protein n=1 Tax=Dreissena polymorpha TaxID=45954 RepID=A0A9D3YP45_DREPO|nr:hypothetical protein DPMN_078604 [Dreissena polymorpha]
MPGLPIEPEVTSDITPLNETSPGALDSLVDAESSLDLEEQGLTEDYKFDETETEQFDEELREVGIIFEWLLMDLIIIKAKQKNRSISGRSTMSPESAPTLNFFLGLP